MSDRIEIFIYCLPAAFAAQLNSTTQTDLFFYYLHNYVRWIRWSLVAVVVIGAAVCFNWKKNEAE